MNSRPRLLDLFCGAGGAAMGYHRAGFDVTGIDITSQPNYPFQFSRDDALAYLAEVKKGDFDVIHASPPCQAHSFISLRGYPEDRIEYPELIDPTRQLLKQTGISWIIENVPGAPLRHDLMLCGEMFDLRVHRHRYFEIDGFLVMRIPHVPHRLKAAENNCDIRPGYTRQITGHYANHKDASEAMGIDWMDRGELNLAIPPAYTEYIGNYLMSAF